jgi:hypothetical protein
MARTVAEIQADLTAVRNQITNAISGGAIRSFSIGGKSFSFDSIASLIELRKDFESELAEAERSGGPFYLANLQGRIA